MKEINYVFSIGYRCNSVQFLRRFEMSKFSGPFDWMYIDLESALFNINNLFESYLNDIVILNKEESKIINIYNKNYNIIKDEIIDLYNSEISYMNENYYKTTLPINQNFTEVNSKNIYDWERICVFLHHNLNSIKEINKIKNRIDRFNNIMKNDNQKVILFYISKILENKSTNEEIDNILFLVKKYDIKANLVLILCTPNEEDEIRIVDNCYFLIKKVPSYLNQYNEFKTDNNFQWVEFGMQGINFENEYEVIKKYFDLSNLFNISVE